MSHQSPGEYIAHGGTPFFRLPEWRHHPDARADAVLLGVPWDGGTTYLPGARLGPYHVRRLSALLGAYHAAHRVDVFERMRAFDGGNVPVPPFSAPAMRELVQARVEAIVEGGAVPFVVGGDHSVSLPCLRAVAKHRGPLAVVHVDAHFDTSDATAWGEAFHHGTPIRHALDEGLVERGQLYRIESADRGMRPTSPRSEPGTAPW